MTPFPQGEAARGALIGVWETWVPSRFCYVTEMQCEVGQVTFRSQVPYAKSEDVNLRSLRILRSPGFVSEISESVLNDHVI